MGFQAAFPSALTMYQQLVIIVRIVLATVCGSVIGLERSRRLKGAGIRTHSVVAAAAACMWRASLPQPLSWVCRSSCISI